MKTVVHKMTGDFLFNVANDDYEPLENERVIDFVPEQQTAAEIRNEKMAATMEKYEVHRKNGWEAYQQLRARIVLDIEEGVLNELMAFVIEKYLKPGYDRIAQNGDWKTALYELGQVTIDPDDAFAVPYFNMAVVYIQNYIATNYEQTP